MKQKLIKGLSIGISAFLLGGFIVLNITSVGAVPSGNPPLNNVDANFRTLGTTSSADLGGSLTVRGTQLSVTGDIMQNVASPDTRAVFGDTRVRSLSINPTGVISSSGGVITLDADLRTTAGPKKIGSTYIRYKYSTSYTPTVTCLPNTQIMGCSAYLDPSIVTPNYSSNGMANIIYYHLGTRTTSAAESCQSYATSLVLAGDSSGPSYVAPAQLPANGHKAYAVCFDPSGAQTAASQEL